MRWPYQSRNLSRVSIARTAFMTESQDSSVKWISLAGIENIDDILAAAGKPSTAAEFKRDEKGLEY